MRRDLGKLAGLRIADDEDVFQAGKRESRGSRKINILPGIDGSGAMGGNREILHGYRASKQVFSSDMARAEVWILLFFGYDFNFPQPVFT